MTSQCSDCGSTEVERDEQQGQVVCTGCGRVLQDYILLAQQQFQESCGGAVTAVGQHVGEGGPRGRGYGRESRAITLEKGKKRIERLAQHLGLRPNLVLEAFNYFKQAVSRHMTQGRNSEHFAAACLYLACRLSANSEQGVMLLDFSDVLHADVYALGRVYMQLCSALHVKIPLLDPCLYIQRFAHSLQFGEKTRKVEETAMRLVQRMKKDWIHWGRRPTGLCGAALLVAARIHDYSRTIQDIVKVVRIGEGTIKKRLLEFEKTDSSKLTIEEFDTKCIDLEQEMDPPCYTEGLRKAKVMQFDEMPDLTDELQKLQDEIEQACNDANSKKNRRYKKVLNGDNTDTVSLCSVAPSISELDDELAQYADLLLPDFVPEDEKSIILKLEKLEKKAFESDSIESAEIRPENTYAAQLRPTAASLGLDAIVADCLNDTNDVEDVQADCDGELDLTDINDEEIDKLILSEEEVKIKTAMWMRQNADFLKELKEKEEKKAKEREEQPEPKRRKIHRRKPKVESEPRSASEAVEKMLQERKLSRKINYDVLKDLNPTVSKTTDNTEVDTNTAGTGSTAVNVKTEKSNNSTTNGESCPTVDLLASGGATLDEEIDDVDESDFEDDNYAIAPNYADIVEEYYDEVYDEY